MTIFALLEDNKVVNVISCDEKIIVEHLFPEYTVVEETEETGKSNIGFEFSNNKFESLKPYSSWIKKGNNWIPPKQIPSDGQVYRWNEETQDWTEVK